MEPEPLNINGTLPCTDLCLFDEQTLTCTHKKSPYNFVLFPDNDKPKESILLDREVLLQKLLDVHNWVLECKGNLQSNKDKNIDHFNNMQNQTPYINLPTNTTGTNVLFPVSQIYAALCILYEETEIDRKSKLIGFQISSSSHLTHTISMNNIFPSRIRNFTSEAHCQNLSGKPVGNLRLVSVDMPTCDEKKETYGPIRHCKHCHRRKQYRC